MEESKIGRRDKRNPGHCWQDNELYDVFQPVIGPLPTHVFATMTRWCRGHEVRIGLRELAEEAGVSRSTAHRATLAMQAMGMIRIRAGAGRESAAYELLDLKEAAQALDAIWDARRYAWVLRPQQVRELKKRLCVSVRDANAETGNPACVPVGDANGCGNLPVVSQLVSQNRGVCVPPVGRPLLQEARSKKKPNPSPTPSRSREGEGGLDGLDGAGETLARELDVSDPAQKRKLRSAIAQYCAKERMSPDEAAAAMVLAWRDYREIEPGLLRFRWGPVKFIAQGHWRNTGGWPWDVREMRMQREARVGMR